MKNLKKLKNISVFFLFICTIAIFTTGCSLFNFDASGYVKACLDANAHGEFEEYAKLTNTSIEEIESTYNKMLDSEISYLDAYNISEEKKNQFRELFIQLYKNFKYEVGEAIKNDDGSYSVPVTTYKLMVFKDVISNGEKYMTDYVQKEMDAGRTPSTDDIYNTATDYMYNSIKSNLDSLEYANPVTTNISVAPTASNSKIYSMDDAELQSLLQSMVDIENAK